MQRDKDVVPETGIEPVRPLSGKRRILSPLCLPISPLGQCSGAAVEPLSDAAESAIVSQASSLATVLFATQRPDSDLRLHSSHLSKQKYRRNILPGGSQHSLPGTIASRAIPSDYNRNLSRIFSVFIPPP